MAKLLFGFFCKITINSEYGQDESTVEKLSPHVRHKTLTCPSVFPQEKCRKTEVQLLKFIENPKYND